MRMLATQNLVTQPVCRIKGCDHHGKFTQAEMETRSMLDGSTTRSVNRTWAKENTLGA